MGTTACAFLARLRFHADNVVLDAFVVINGGGSPAELRVRLYGTRARTWNVTRTSDAGEESVHLGIMSSAGEVISYEAPPFSGTTFLGL